MRNEEIYFREGEGEVWCGQKKKKKCARFFCLTLAPFRKPGIAILLRASVRADLYAAATRVTGTVTVSCVRELGRVAGATSKGAGVAARAAVAAGRRWREREGGRGVGGI